MKNINPRFAPLTSFSAIVDTMIKGLENEWVEVDMYTYGSVKEVYTNRKWYQIFKPKTKQVCVGCAATNTLCELMQESFTIENIDEKKRFRQFNYSISIKDLKTFETSIDCLRQGWALSSLMCLASIKDILPLEIPTYSDILPPFELPALDTHNWKTNIEAYKEYSKWLKEKGF